MICVHFNVSSFLDLYAQNLSGYTHILEKNSRSSSSLRSLSLKSSVSHYMVPTLASSAPETKEHIKLLDRLSEPSSNLIHRIYHPSKEKISSEPNNSCFICIRVHGFTVCNPLFCKKASCINIASKNSSRK